jgi:hypothetical protein
MLKIDEKFFCLIKYHPLDIIPWINSVYIRKVQIFRTFPRPLLKLPIASLRKLRYI